MGENDDPFGLSNDAGRTRIRPVRSDRPAVTQGTSPGPTAAFAPAPAASGVRARLRHSRAGANPLVAAFAPLMEFAPELERATAPPQAESLRVRLFDALIDARDAAVGQGVPLARADQGAWCVAALIDDLALNTPWGGHSDWPRQPLVTQLSGEVDAGTRFFERFEDLLRHPNRDPHLLELAYLCLGLGFRGKYRVQGTAADGAILALRGQAARLLRNPDREQAPLSPHWQGVAAPDQPRRFALPLWAVAVAAAALVTALYAGLGLQLSTRSEQLFTLANALPPTQRAELFRPVRDTAAEPPKIELAPTSFELLPAITAAAPPETAKAIDGNEDPALVVLRLQGSAPELFRSAKADLNAEYQPLIAAIAGVLKENDELIGGVTVIGHTDNVPVQRSNPFASNQGLSEARAERIAALLAASGVPEAKLRHEGHADAEPIAGNDTKEGRARNRRVEIRIEKRL